MYIVEEAEKLGLVFVGGTALNLVLFNEYRASEDIDFYNPDSKSVENPDGREEHALAEQLGKRLAKKGFDIPSTEGRITYIGPSIKIEIFNDGTAFKKIEKRKIEGTTISLFNPPTYAEMKMTALLCRTHYDPRDLVDVFVIHRKGRIKPAFPRRECEIIEKYVSQRLQEIQRTKKADLLLFQSREQIDALPYNKFEKFKGWFIDWLSEFR